MLLPEDLRMLVALQNNPLGTYKELGEALNVTPPTVKTRLLKLSEKLDKSPDPNSPSIAVKANLNLKALNLEMTNVLVETSFLAVIKQIEKVLYQHPYTSYHVRCIGKNQGLFIQFLAPKGTYLKLHQLMSRIHQARSTLVKSFKLLPASELSIYTNFDLQAWNEEAQCWEFNWKDWIAKLNELTGSVLNLSSPKYTDLILSRLSSFDLQILQELTWNSRRRNKDLIEILLKDYPIPINRRDENSLIEPYQMTRRLKFLNEQAILGYRVEPNWKVFNIFDSLLFFCRTSRELAYKWANLLNKCPIPFKSTFQLLKDGFFWFIGCPSAHFSEISEIIWEQCPDFDFYLLDYRTSKLYPIWWETFNENTKSWRIDNDFMIDVPLKEIES